MMGNWLFGNNLFLFVSLNNFAIEIIEKFWKPDINAIKLKKFKKILP